MLVCRVKYCLNSDIRFTITDRVAIMMRGLLSARLIEAAEKV